MGLVGVGLLLVGKLYVQAHAHAACLVGSPVHRLHHPGPPPVTTPKPASARALPRR